MSKKKHPNECTICEQIPCKCAGGGGADEEKSEKDGEVNVNVDKQNTDFANSALNNACVLNSSYMGDLGEGVQTMLLDQSGQLAYCTFFAETATLPVVPLSDNLDDEENATCVLLVSK